MAFYHELPYPVYVVKAVRTSGATKDLKGGEIMLADSSTYTALSVADNSAQTHPEVLIAGGSWHTKDKLTQFIGGLSESVKSVDFLGKDVLGFEISRPKDLLQDIIQIGWDGVSTTGGLQFEAGKTKRIKINVYGEDTFRTYSRPLYRFVEVTADCPPNLDCSDGCDTRVDPKKYGQRLVDNINNDVELKYFVRAELVTSDYVETEATHTLYNLSVCDNGDIVALADVRRAYPTLTIDRIARNGSISVYQVCRITTAGAPGDFTPVSPILTAVCGTCPGGYTSVAARDVYIVKRPITPTTDLDDLASRGTYAATIVSAYSAINGTGKFLGIDDGTALVQISFAAGTSVSVASGTSDIITLSHSEPAVCLPPANSAISWTSVGTRYKINKTQTVLIPKTCGGANRLTDIQAFYANSTEIVPNSIVIVASGDCADRYNIQVYSNECSQDSCLSKANVTYPQIQSFEGYIWEDVEPSGEPDLDVQVGIRLYAAYQDTKFNVCSFEPTDYYSVRPIRLTASEVNESGDPCIEGAEVHRIQHGQVASQSGEWLIRQYLKYVDNEAYGSWYNDPRLREVLDNTILEFINKNKRYVVYYVIYKQNRDGNNWDSQHTKDKYETLVAFEEGTDTATFEQTFGGYFSQFGVALKERGV